jgi:hypothetical protein
VRGEVITSPHRAPAARLTAAGYVPKATFFMRIFDQLKGKIW